MRYFDLVADLLFVLNCGLAVSDIVRWLAAICNVGPNLRNRIKRNCRIGRGAIGSMNYLVVVPSVLNDTLVFIRTRYRRNNLGSAIRNTIAIRIRRRRAVKVPILTIVTAHTRKLTINLFQCAVQRHR